LRHFRKEQVGTEYSRSEKISLFASVPAELHAALPLNLLLPFANRYAAGSSSTFLIAFAISLSVRGFMTNPLAPAAFATFASTRWL